MKTVKAISKTSLPWRAAHRVCGGVRGYTLLLGMKTRMQLPVLHLTGHISKVLLLFTSECMPGEIKEAARATFLPIKRKGKMDALYLREHR